MRLFLAIALPEEVKDTLAAVQSDLTAGRRMDPDTFHLTLAFLGEQSEAAAEELDLELQRLSSPAFALTLAGFDIFGGSTPAVLFAGVADPGPVTELHKAVRRRIRSAGIELERERFRPHVTLARFRKRLSPEGLEAIRMFLSRNAGFRAEPFPVESVVLYESEVLGEGAVHTELARYPLLPGGIGG